MRRTKAWLRLSRRRLGQETYERLVQPLVGGIYTADPEKLSLRATLPRFAEMERLHGSLIRAARADRGSGKKDSSDLPDDAGRGTACLWHRAKGFRVLWRRLRSGCRRVA